MYFNEIAERGILSCAMGNIDAREKLLLLPDDIFYLDINRSVYNAIKGLYHRGLPTTLSVVYAEMEAIGRSKDFNSFLEFNTSSFEVDGYIDILLDCLAKRQIEVCLEDNLEELKKGSTVEEITRNVGGVIYGIIHGREDGEEAAEIPVEGILNLESRFIKTGFDNLDHHINGLFGSRLYILAARTSQGKTTFAMNIAQNVCKLNEGQVLFFSLEMTAADLLYIIVSNETEVSLQRITRGEINEKERKSIIGCQEIIKEKYHNLKFFGPRFQNLDNIEKQILRHAKIKKPALVIVDYLQLIKVPWIKEKRHKVNEASQMLKNLAGKLDVPFLVLSQIRRVEKEAWPELSDLKESGDIENDADIVIFFHYEEKREKRWIIVAKNKYGSCGKDVVIWQKPIYKFLDGVDC